LVEVTDGVMPGVVSIPQRMRHDLDRVELSVAADHAGSSFNAMADEPRAIPSRATPSSAASRSSSRS
jgi:hypothetical protein